MVEEDIEYLKWQIMVWKIVAVVETGFAVIGGIWLAKSLT